METFTLEWTARFSPFRNRLVIKQMILAFGIPILLLGLLMCAITEENRWLVAMQVMGVVAGVLAVLLLPVIGLFALVGYEQHFVLDTDGVTATLSGRTNTFFRGVRILLLLSGRPGAMGSGLMMRTGDSIRWQEVHRVDVDREQKVLTLYRESGSPFLLACSPENFATVCEIVQAQTSIGVQWKE